MVKIKSMIRKSVNCLVTLSLMFFVFLFVYACSSDADYSAKIEDIDRNLLIKSVAESDVFLDFILEHKLVMEQFMVYTRRLSDTELSEFKYNVNAKDCRGNKPIKFTTEFGNKEKLFISGCWIW